ncbi:hypothetical protein ZWY2020_010357 [Hordeum vulgare]|nr:hypothetical protein ZWY2020_010357 [Hordeum vulgare]
MWPDQSGAASFAAFFNMQRHRDQGAKVLVLTPWSPLGRGRRAISSFVHNVPSSLLYRAAPLVCRRGLLLVHLLPPRGRTIHGSIAWPCATCSSAGATCSSSNGRTYGPVSVRSSRLCCPIR